MSRGSVKARTAKSTAAVINTIRLYAPASIQDWLIEYVQATPEKRAEMNRSLEQDADAAPAASNPVPEVGR